MMAVSDFVGDCGAGPEMPLLQSGVSLDVPNFAGDVDKLQIQNFGGGGGGALIMGPGRPPRGSGDVLAVPDFVGGVDPGPGGPCWSRQWYSTGLV